MRIGKPRLIYVTPGPGLMVPMPAPAGAVGVAFLGPGGAKVRDSDYWRRKRDAGEITITAPTAPAAEPVPGIDDEVTA